MIISKKIRLLSLLLLVTFTANAQKKPLDHDVYDSWKGIGNTTISNDGQWVYYTVNPQVGDGQVEVIQVNGDQKYVIPRAKNLAMSSTSQFVVGKIAAEYLEVRKLKLKKTSASKLPKDSLFILNLNSGDIRKEARVKSYQIADESGEWIAFLFEKPLKKSKKDKKDTTETSDKKEEVKKPKSKSKGTELVLLNLLDGTEHRFDYVMDYALSEEGNYLFFEQDEADSLNPSGVYAFNTKKGDLTALNEGMTDYKKLTIDKSGEQLAFLATGNDKKDKEKNFGLMYWKAGQKEAQVVVDTMTTGMPERWEVSANGNFRFSDSGKRLYIATSPRPIKYAYEEDTTLLKEDRPEVDIWKWDDDYIQPMQKLNATRERNRSFLAHYDFKGKRVVQLAGPDLQTVNVNYENDLDFAVGMDDLQYRMQLTWDTQYPRDYYKVDINTGNAELLAGATRGFVQTSPEGKYAYWYNMEDRHWYLMDMSSKSVRNLTADMDVNFWNELHDSPSMPRQYGSPGWTEKDGALLLYDRYDIWKFDPTGKNAPVNITNGYGRANNITMRYQRLDRDETTISSKRNMTLSAFQNWTKQSGYFQTSVDGGADPTKIVLDDYRFYGLSKAKNSDQILLRRSRFDQFPELWTANNLSLEGLKMRTNVGKQMDPYLWGTAELVEYDVLEDGETMQGLLYKPANFDPSKKYPLMVYFYERRSNSLHNFINPTPSRSTVNIAYYASNGYVVLVPDIKYQDGYPGPSAYNCVIPATNKVAGMGFIDKSKMAIQGQSWGGYQVAYLVTKTKMFAAAGAGAPVVNMTSAYGGVRWGSGMSRMFQYEKTQSRLGGTLWDKPSRYIDNSPLFRADEIETPLFIMHNDKDGAVPWYQGIEFYMSLRRLQKPAWMVSYNEEAHNLTKRKNMKDLSIRMTQFFDHYLKGEPMPEWMAYGLPAKLKGRTLRYDLVKEEENKIKEGQPIKVEKTKKKE